MPLSRRINYDKSVIIQYILNWIMSNMIYNEQNNIFRRLMRRNLFANYYPNGGWDTISN